MPVNLPDQKKIYRRRYLSS